MSPEKQDSQSDQPEGATQRPPRAVRSWPISISSMSAHNAILV
jgi:hypothetical protein